MGRTSDRYKESCEEDLSGKWAVCGHGRLARITGKKQLPWGEAWVGDALDGKLWSSTQPRVIAPSQMRFLNLSAEVVL